MLPPSRRLPLQASSFINKGLTICYLITYGRKYVRVSIANYFIDISRLLENIIGVKALTLFISKSYFTKNNPSKNVACKVHKKLSPPEARTLVHRSFSYTSNCETTGLYVQKLSQELAFLR
jgi:hypothetical protein